jgi:hypothetical protein
MKKLFTFFVCLSATVVLQAQTFDLPSGSGTIGSPYQISSLENLYWIAASNAEVPSPNQATRWAAYYEQTANIDASPTSGWFSGAGWRPIGYENGTRSGISFTGSYDGQGHTISGLYINSSIVNIYQGFVGYIGSGGTVSNLGLTSVNITGVYCTGGIAGGNEGTISDCYCSGSVTANNENGWGGGIVGYIIGTVTQCYFNGTVSGTGTMFGGVVAASEGTISKCYNTGSVTGNNYVGGIVGYTLGIVSNCYNKGTISGANEIGGIAGENDNTIQYCYNIGTVSGTGSNIGAIAGADGGGGTIYTSTLWDSESSGITQGAGWTTPDPSGITGKTTAQMKNAGTFTTAGWDFTLSGGKWGMNGTNNNGYPWLRFEGYTSSHVWLGNSSTLWGTATNWSEGSVPTSTNNVIIPDVTNDPVIGATTTANCNNLTVTGSLTIQSSASGTGSLIVSGTPTGNVTAERWMTAGSWHIVSSPLSGQTISNFLGTGNLTTIATNGTARGMMDYDPTGNSWNTFFTNATGGNLETGKGFSMRVGATNAAVTFTGALQTGALSATGLADGKWNCVGNPYTSAIGITTGSGAAANFLTVNTDNFAPSFGAIYVWNKPDASNGNTGNYTVITNTAPAFNDVQQGQAFMVNMKTGVTSLSFTSAMQIHSPALELKSAKVAWPVIKLKATVGQQVSSTIVAFNSDMTKGLDPTYDAGLLKGASDLIVYSKLVEDNGIPFAVQALPDNDYSNMIVPVGLDFKTGGEVVFSAEMSNLSPDCKVILEDKLTRTFTDLSRDVYKVTIAAKSVISDRFNLHTSYQTTGTSPLLPTSAFNLKAYPANGEIVIEGEVGNQAQAILFDVNGRNLGTFKLQEGSQNSISSDGLAPGVYLLNVTEASKKFNTKIVIY